MISTGNFSDVYSIRYEDTLIQVSGSPVKHIAAQAVGKINSTYCKKVNAPIRHSSMFKQFYHILCNAYKDYRMD